jgi:hypothetical protein
MLMDRDGQTGHDAALAQVFEDIQDCRRFAAGVMLLDLPHDTLNHVAACYEQASRPT